MRRRCLGIACSVVLQVIVAIVVFPLGAAAQVPAGAVSCGNGNYCPAGNACLADGLCGPRVNAIPGSTMTSTGSTCMPGTHENKFFPGACTADGNVACPPVNGRPVSCPPGYTCGANGGCNGPPPQGPYCGGRRCVVASNVCSSAGSCMDPTTQRDCGGGRICSIYAACGYPSGCVTVGSTRTAQIPLSGSSQAMAPPPGQTPTPAVPPLAGGAAPTIVAVQVLLTALGFDPGPPDGFAGAKTSTAIAEFQKSIGERPDGQPSEALRGKLQKALAERAARSPAQPNQAATPSAPSGPAEKKKVSSGTGFFVGSNVIITNHHVAGECADVHIRKNGAEIGTARLLATSQSDDLAALRVDKAWDTVLKLRVGVPLKAAEPIVVFGYPLAGALSSSGNTTLGNITALTGLRDDSRFIQISAAVQPGNSGGPVLDEAGRLIAVVQGKLDALRLSRITGDITQNVNFAIRGSTLVTFLEAHRIAYEVDTSSTPLSSTQVAERAEAASVELDCWR